jgi:hypothetical protein
MEKESNKDTWYLFVEGRNVYKNKINWEKELRLA